MIEFSIPDFWQQSLLNSFIINIKTEHPEFFYDDIAITSTFGSFPCNWNGGRGVIQGIYTGNIIRNIIEFYNSNNVSVRHTFTNKFLKESDMYDRTGNLVCEISCEIGKKYNIQNGCTIYSKVMEDYLQKKYPDLQIIYSTTKELKTIEGIDKYSKNNLVIPSYTINHDMDILEKLKYPEHVELLCLEQGCYPNCPQREVHQDAVSHLGLNEYEEADKFNEMACPIMSAPYTNWYERYNDPAIYISIDQIRKDYLPLGFNKYKISGRGFTVSVLINNIESYLNYFIKPEYRDFIRIELLNLILPEESVPIGALNYI